MDKRDNQKKGLNPWNAGLELVTGIWRKLVKSLHVVHVDYEHYELESPKNQGSIQGNNTQMVFGKERCQTTKVAMNDIEN